MGRHSRRGPAAKDGGTAETTAGRDGRDGRTGREGREVRDRREDGDRRESGEGRDRGAGRPGPGAVRDGRQPQGAAPAGRRPGPAPAPGQQPRGAVPGQAYGDFRLPDGTPAYGTPRTAGGGTPAYGTPRTAGGGTPAHGTPRTAGGGTPAHGAPRFADGTPARGVPRVPDGAAARGVPGAPAGTPAHGVPGAPDTAPAHGGRARGGHPEQREAGGAWGAFEARGGVSGARERRAARPDVALPRQRQAPPAGPRQAYLDAFDEEEDAFARRSPATVPSSDPSSPPPGRNAASGRYAETGRNIPPGRNAASGRYAETGRNIPPGRGAGSGRTAEPGGGGGDGAASPAGEPAERRGTKGRTFTGIAAAAVTTVLAVVVAGQVTDGRTGNAAQPQSAADGAGEAIAAGGPDGSSGAPGATPLSYEQKMNLTYPLSPTLKGSGAFDVVPGFAEAPGKGRKYTYRVDVERGLGLDGELFAEAVHKTLNDDRSWAHGGERTFERVSSGEPDFVITLASPGTTAEWCAKSGLDTTEDNVSCDSAATERVMINAYRWAQGSTTYGKRIHAYRQMLINHEVGHRLGHGHVDCEKDGELAPVMQQQTKFLDHDGIHCLPNAWVHPEG
ncbi:DUF3152 domain-containing protein [Streptomyces sp. NPDC046831]|uniref:DUF3152 domain-containing protein n=1 Tax=Streptomyces sp. NPDC046831 TaxID=3154805 RepID=UPI0033E03BE9